MKLISLQHCTCVILLPFPVNAYFVFLDLCAAVYNTVLARLSTYLLL